MAIDISKIANIPALPATLREAPKVSTQVSAEMDFMRDVRNVAVANLTKTPAGECAHSLLHSHVDQCGAPDKTVLAAASEIIKDMVNIANSRTAEKSTQRTR